MDDIQYNGTGFHLYTAFLAHCAVQYNTLLHIGMKRTGMIYFVIRTYYCTLGKK